MDTLTLRSRLLKAESSHFLEQTFISYARHYILGALKTGIHKGALTIVEKQEKNHFSLGSNPVTLNVINDRFWGRFFLGNHIGFAEAYMSGDIDVSSLKDILNLWLDNRGTLVNLDNPISNFFAYYTAVVINFTFRQSLKISKASVAISYDVSNDFMRCFMSEEMMYSAALWSEKENGPRGDLSVGPTAGDLEAAQQRKIQHFLKKARLRPGDRLLEIGCGWGAVSIAAAKMGCFVEAITLSTEQKSFAEQRIAEANLSHLVTVRLCDYRELPREFEHSFDACISIEMFEAVGLQHHEAYFRVIDWALKVESGTAVISCTTLPEHRYTKFQSEDFARRYHWPNTHIPSPTSFISALDKAVSGRFVVHSIEDYGIHYCRTLREWGRRFDRNFNGSIVEDMKRKYPFLNSQENFDAFVRKWRYIFVYAEVGFARAYVSVHQFTFARPENASEPCS